MRINDRIFFITDAVKLAKKLLGKTLVRKIGDQKIIRVKITETEAYVGKIDRACHAHSENRSYWKAKSLFKDGGYIYVYLIYGIYYCFNIVCSTINDPQGVLIRRVEILENDKKISINGPGRLCKFLNIDLKLNGIDLINNNEIYLENTKEISAEKIIATKRINIDYAKEDKEFLWRFYIKT